MLAGELNTFSCFKSIFVAIQVLMTVFKTFADSRGLKQSAWKLHQTHYKHSFWSQRYFWFKNLSVSVTKAWKDLLCFWCFVSVNFRPWHASTGKGIQWKIDLGFSETIKDRKIFFFFFNPALKMNKQVFGGKWRFFLVMLVANTSGGWKGTRILKHGGHTWGLYCSSFHSNAGMKVAETEILSRTPSSHTSLPSAFKVWTSLPFFLLHKSTHNVSGGITSPPPLLLQPEIRICLYSMKIAPHNPPVLALLLLSTTFGWVLSLSAVFSSSSPSALPLH